MGKYVATLPRAKATQPPVQHGVTPDAGATSIRNGVTSDADATSQKELADGMDFTCPVCLDSGKLLQDPCRYVTE